jgi:hypothetical protein
MGSFPPRGGFWLSLGLAFDFESKFFCDMGLLGFFGAALEAVSTTAPGFPQCKSLCGPDFSL